MYKLTDIRKVHLEVTQNCQARCPMCDRNENGGAVNKHINLDELTLDDCKNMFPSDFIAQLDAMYMCGNLGDPIVATDTLEIFKYFREHNPKMWLSMNTNAGARTSRWWEELAHIFNKKGAVIFSVDGLIDTNHIYRQGVNWQVVESSMKSFISAGGRARWDFLIFDYNEHQVEDARTMADEWGFEKFIPKKTGRFITSGSEKKTTHVVNNRKGKQTTSISTPKNDQYKNKELTKQDVIIEKYGSMDEYYDAAPIVCKVKDEGNLFISAEGLVLPCCWTAGRMYKWWHADHTIEQIWDFIKDVGGKDVISAKINGLQSVFDTGIFETIEKSWSKPSCVDGKLKVCSMKCGAEFDPFTAQFE